MVKANTIIEIGERLRKSDIKELSTTQLSELLSKATGSMGKNTIKNYIQILKREGYIRFNYEGYWEIVR